MKKNTFEKLNKEWSDKNIDSLADYTEGSNHEAVWVCSEGHEWKEAIKLRYKGYGCPFCSSHRVLSGYNDLFTKNPKLAREWHPIKNKDLQPTQVTPNSNKKVWWICEKGHEWEAKIAKRTKGKGCPYCSGKKVIVGETDLATTNPELVKEWDYEKNEKTPEQYSPHSNKIVHWKCIYGHEWTARINARGNSKRPNMCPYCSGKKVIEGKTDLTTTNPELVEEWDYEKNDVDPEMFSKMSKKKVYWVCSKGHSYRATIANRALGRGCPQCAKKIVYKLY